MDDDWRREKRDRRRFAGPFSVTLEIDGENATGEAVDLSAGGLLLRLDQPLETGKRFILQVCLPNYDPLLVRGEVVGEHRGGYGVRFLQPSRQTLSFLDAYAAVVLAEDR